MYRWQL